MCVDGGDLRPEGQLDAVCGAPPLVSDDDSGDDAAAVDTVRDLEEEARFEIKRAERDAFAGISGFRKAASVYVPKDSGAKCWGEHVVVAGVQFTSDSATALAVHARYIAIGTQKGRVIFADQSGHPLAGVAEVHDAAQHHAAVTAVSVSRCGNLVATCSRDGTVCVRAPFDNAPPLRAPLSDPLRTISLNPGSSSYKDFACVAGGKSGGIHHVTNTKNTFLSGIGLGDKFAKATLKTKPLGVIHSVAYGAGGDVVAWGSETGVCCYDVASEGEVELPWLWDEETAAAPSPAPSPSSSLGAASPSDTGKCCVRFEDGGSVLLAAWGGTVAAVLLLPRPTSEEWASTGHASAYTAQVLYRTVLRDTVCGVAPWGAGRLLALTLPAADVPSLHDSRGAMTSWKAPRAQPQLTVLSRNGDVLREERTYKMQLAGVENIFAPHYVLADEQGAEDSESESESALTAFYVLTPKELLAVQPREPDAHIDHLAAAGAHDEALRCLTLREAALRTELATREHDYCTVLLGQAEAKTQPQRYGSRSTTSFRQVRRS